METVLTKAQKIALLNSLDDGTTGVLKGCKVHLYKASTPIDDNVLLADLTAVEADYTGYAAKTAVFGAVFEDGGELKREAVSLQFQPTGSGVTNDIYGEYYTITDGTVLIGVKKYDEKVPMTGVLSALISTPTVAYGD